jgi:protein TonB
MAIERARIVVGAGLVAAFVFAMTLALAPPAPAQGQPQAPAQSTPQVPPPPSAFPGQPYVTGAPVVYQPPLEYPREAKERGREGTVVVAFLVNEKGEVERYRIIESDPPLLFDSVVNAAVPSFRFAPAMRNGKPSSYETRLTLSFKPQGRDGPK